MSIAMSNGEWLIFDWSRAVWIRLSVVCGGGLFHGNNAQPEPVADEYTLSHLIEAINSSQEEWLLITSLNNPSEYYRCMRNADFLEVWVKIQISGFEDVNEINHQPFPNVSLSLSAGVTRRPIWGAFRFQRHENDIAQIIHQCLAALHPLAPHNQHAPRFPICLLNLWREFMTLAYRYQIAPYVEQLRQQLFATLGRLPYPWLLPDLLPIILDHLVGGPQKVIGHYQ